MSNVLPASKKNLRENDSQLFKKIFYECVACFCLTFGTISLPIAFFMALKFSMSLMIKSLAIPIDSGKSH